MSLLLNYLRTTTLYQRAAVLLFVLFSISGAAFVLAQSSLSPTYKVYTPKNDTGTAYTTRAGAADAYMKILAQRAIPSNHGRCWRYYWTVNESEGYTDAEWTNGALILNCTWPAPGSGNGADNIWAITTEVPCYELSTDDRCQTLFGAANEKNAGPTCAVDNKPQGQASCGNPINIGTGNKFQVETDFEVPGSPWLNFNRVYNSQMNRARGAAMGFRWRHSLDYELQTRLNGEIALLRPDGAVRVYSSPSGPSPDSLGSLTTVRNTEGSIIGYTFDDQDGQIESYTKSGAITRIDFRAGGYLIFTYSAAALKPTQVTDHFGRSLTFVYDSWARITSVTTPAGAIYSYTYDAYDRLLTRVAPGSQTKTYLYDVGGSNLTRYQRGLLAKVTDETGATIGQYKYDNLGRAIETMGDAGINKFSVTYGTDIRTVKLPLGAVVQTTFSTILGTPRITGTATTCPGGTCTAPNNTSASFDANGNLVSSVQSDGSKTCMEYDLSRNLVIRTITGLVASTDCTSAFMAGAGPLPARTTTIQWHSSFRAPLEIATAMQRQSFSYDSQGRLLTRSTGATSDTTGALGFGATIVGAPRVETMSYNSAGQLLSYKGPRTDINETTSYEYSANGLLTKITNPAGQITSFSLHNGDGRPGKIVLPSGLDILLAYDARGQIVSSTEGGLTTTFTYYPNGRLASTTLPSGEAVSLTYDSAGRITKATDQRGNSKTWTHNLDGGATNEQTKNASGAILLESSRVFDALNRVTQLTGAHVINTQPAPFTP